ncbi:MAG: cation diffusion facilitator family transporter [Planctomycetota bacterium]|nr:cation diffusion facilitator family transporter [Planctomycetota bacterium]
MADSATKPHLYKDVMRAATLGLLANLGLCVVKVAGGLVGNSFALLADAFNSLGDVVTSAIVIFSLRVAQRPADKEHPYGHTRAETIAASNVCLLIVVGAIVVGVESVRRLSLVHPLPPAWTLWIAGANFAIKEGLYRYKSAVGRRAGSAAILAHAWDHRGDALCSLAVLVGIGIVHYAGIEYIWADEVSALVVVLAVIWSAMRLFRDTLHDLMDPQAKEDLVQAVRKTASSVAGVMDVEKLWLRKSGLEYFADIHVHVAPELSVAEGHAIGHAVKDRILEEHPHIRDVLVHLEPGTYPSPRVRAAQTSDE